ncbi:hypothetical protein A4X09_0g5626 [Tilletia walkeri]|uniref:Nitrogen regulatory protein areA GATA-like domain-containing protein n=1 Tax=Tilletia walkeri TaxID=117179 RepID=A0A8X7T3V5_9BASI|nr:hypothetical protein A4X09_0g5626 [Tilletia walkeri]
MMSAPSPYPVITDTSSPLPDDAQINTVLPSICVDYLSHHWDKDEQIWASWKAMTKSKNEITNGVRLENASWRTWAKQRGKLKTISPETLNWLKDSDVTWLYGPLHEKANPVPPPKQATFADRLGLENIPPKPKDIRASKRSAASSPNVLRVDESGRARKVGSERRRAAGAERGTNSSKRSTPAPKSILKHRTIQDMLTLNIGRRAASPAIHTDSMTGCLSTPPTPEVVPSTVASSPSAAETSQRADGLFCTRSDTNLPATGVDATVVMPGTPTEGATDYLAAVRLTGSSSTSSASPSATSPSFGPEVSLPQIVLPSIATSTASRPPLVRGEGGEQQAEEVSSTSSSRRSLVFEDRGKRSDRHISFNHRVEQCIALDETSTDAYSTTLAEQGRSQTPTAFGSSAAMMVPDSSAASSTSIRSQPILQLYEPDEEEDEEEDDYLTEEEEEENAGSGDVVDDDNAMGEASTAEPTLPVLLHSDTGSRTVTSHVPLDDEDHADYLRFKHASELPSSNSSEPRVYTGSASSEEDLSVTSSSDAGYDSDALTMRSSSVGSISGSSASHMSTREQMMTAVSRPHRPKSRKGSMSSSFGMHPPNPTSAAMHTIAKLAPTLLKTSEAYPAPSPAVVDPSNFLQTLEHERSAEEERRAAQFEGYHFAGAGGNGMHNVQGGGGGGIHFVSTAAPWSSSGSAYDSSYFANAPSHSTGGDIYGASVPVSIPTFGGRDQQQHRHDDRGYYSVSASAAVPHASYQDHHQHVYDHASQSSAPSSSSSYHRMEQGNYHHPRQHQEPQPPHYASHEYADGFLDYEDDDIDIDLSFDADDVDLDLDLDDDYADDEQVYLNTYTTYRRQLGGGGGLGRKIGGEGEGKYGSAAAAAAAREEAYERMQTSVDSLAHPSVNSATASSSSNAGRQGR